MGLGEVRTPVSTCIRRAIRTQEMELMLSCPGPPDPGLAPNYHPLQLPLNLTTSLQDTGSD